MNLLRQRTINLLAAAMVALSAGAAESPQSGETSVTIHADQPGEIINKNIYGQFSEHLGRCIYEGIWVGENSSIPNTRGIRNDVVAALKAMKVPVVRWPGGCFADEYHWRDGIGPRQKRPAMINTHWGGVVENNNFGTHEFLDFCEQIGAEPYICGNVGSGSPQEMMEWVEYITSDADSPMANLRRRNGREKPWKLPYFGVGNESWGCGGNMRPEFYADNFRRYNTFVKNYPGNQLYRIACGANSEDYRWTEVVMDVTQHKMNGLSMHYYTVPTGNWGRKGSATRFEEDQWFSTMKRALKMEELVEKHSAIMDKTDPKKHVGLIVDEWGTWYDVEPGTNPGFLYQQNSLRDALVAGTTLNIFNNHCDRVKMANIAQMINVLQSMILTDKERMVLTPTYHVYELYAVHQGAKLLHTEVQTVDYASGSEGIPAVNISASMNREGRMHVTLCNLDPVIAKPVNCVVKGVRVRSCSGRMITAEKMTAHNTFDNPDSVRTHKFEEAKPTNDGFSVKLPPKSVVMLEVMVDG